MFLRDLIRYFFYQLYTFYILFYRFTIIAYIFEDLDIFFATCMHKSLFSPLHCVTLHTFYSFDISYFIRWQFHCYVYNAICSLVNKIYQMSSWTNYKVQIK